MDYKRNHHLVGPIWLRQHLFETSFIMSWPKGGNDPDSSKEMSALKQRDKTNKASSLYQVPMKLDGVGPVNNRPSTD